MDGATPKDAPLLEVRDLAMSIFADGGNRIVRAVNGLSFTLARGRTLGIIGESGSGKSMTSLSILRLLPRGARILGGQVLFEGRDLVALSERELRRMRGRPLAMILQDPRVSLDPLYRVGDQVAEPLRTHQGMGGDALRARVIELLGAVGIPAPESRFDQYPHQMSGGMLQRIVGATAISCGPELLIADEPTTALDPTVQAQYLDLLEELQQRTGLALIVITHDLGVAARLCDNVIVMYAGRAAEKAPSALCSRSRPIPIRRRCCRPCRGGGRPAFIGVCRRSRASRPISRHSRRAVRSRRAARAPMSNAVPRCRPR